MRGFTSRWDRRRLWVAIFGVDGAGKSAVIKRLADELSPPFTEIQQFHFRPMFRRQKKDSAPVTDPHAKAPRSMLASASKLLYWLVDYWYGYVITTRPAPGFARIAIFDRYLNDILVDPRRYRLPESIRWFSRWIVLLAPHPDLYILLDVPAAVVRQRKDELSPAESDRQRTAYLEIFRLLPNALVVDASLSVEEVAEQVKTAILKFLTGCVTNRAEGSLIADV